MTARTSTATYAVLRTEARLFGRELGSLFWIILFPLALVCIIGAIPGFREDDPELGGLSAVDLYVPVSILLSMIMAAIMSMPAVILAYREAGVLRRLQTTPVRPSSLILAQVVLHAGAVAASTALVLAAGRIIFGTPLPQSWPGYLAAYLLVLAASFSLGAVVTAIAPNPRVGNALGMVVFFAAMFTAGVWVPVQVLSGWLRDLVGLTPLGAASEAMTQAMLGDFPDPRHLLVVAAWTVLLGALSLRLFRWE